MLNNESLEDVRAIAELTGVDVKIIENIVLLQFNWLAAEQIDQVVTVAKDFPRFFYLTGIIGSEHAPSPPGDDEFIADFSDTRGSLRTLLGDAGYLQLLERYAGCRLYVPQDPSKGRLSHEIGKASAARLCSAAGGIFIRVPIERELRAFHYRDDLRMSNRQIAVRLGMTENSVMKIFNRRRKREAHNVR